MHSPLVHWRGRWSKEPSPYWARNYYLLWVAWNWVKKLHSPAFCWWPKPQINYPISRNPWPVINSGPVEEKRYELLLTAIDGHSVIIKVKLCLVLIEIFHLYLRCTVEEHMVYKEASIENIRKIRLCQPPPLPFLCMILGCDLNNSPLPNISMRDHT